MFIEMVAIHKYIRYISFSNDKQVFGDHNTILTFGDKVIDYLKKKCHRDVFSMIDSIRIEKFHSKYIEFYCFKRNDGDVFFDGYILFDDNGEIIERKIYLVNCFD